MHSFRLLLWSFLVSILSGISIQSYSQNPQEVIDSARAAYDRQDFEQAAGLFYKLAEEGFPEAMLELAYMLRDGIGLPVNENKALQYLEDAAEKGYKPSFQPLAEMYDKKGMKEEAMIFYKLTVKEFPENLKKIAFYYFDEEYYEEAWPYVKKLAKTNDPDAVFLQGIMTYEGMGTDANPKSGVRYLKKAAEMGHPAAVNYLKEISETNDSDTDDEPDFDID